MWSPTVMAIRLSGALKTEVALPDLLDRIAVDYPTHVTDRETVACLAVSQYGAKAIPPIIERASTASDEEWKWLLRTLRLIGHPEVVQAVAEEALSDTGIAPFSRTVARLMKLAIPENDHIVGAMIEAS